MPYRDQRVFGVAVAVAMVAAIGLSGCGRKGPLEPPPGQATLAPDTNPITSAAAPPAPPPPPKPDRPFILDPLLD